MEITPPAKTAQANDHDMIYHDPNVMITKYTQAATCIFCRETISSVTLPSIVVLFVAVLDTPEDIKQRFEPRRYSKC